MGYEFWIIIGVCLVFLIVGLSIIRSGQTRGTGEICIRAGVWKCTICGELIPMSKGKPFPPCCNDGTRWRYAGTKRQYPDARG